MRKPLGLLALSITTFVLLGMPKSAFGIAWPSVAGDFGRSIGDLGLVIAVYVIGYFVSSVATGALSRRFQMGPPLMVAAALATVSLVGYAVATSWVWLLMAAAGLGLAGGIIDAGVNAVVAVRHGARAMGLLHAGFGVGATLGPLMMTALIETDSSWRIGFVLLAVGQGALALLYVRTRSRWDVAVDPVDLLASAGPGRRGVMMGALAVFALYSGVEIGAGQWAYSLLTEGRGLSTGDVRSGRHRFLGGSDRVAIGPGAGGSPGVRPSTSRRQLDAGSGRRGRILAEPGDLGGTGGSRGGGIRPRSDLPAANDPHPQPGGGGLHAHGGRLSIGRGHRRRSRRSGRDGPTRLEFRAGGGWFGPGGDHRPDGWLHRGAEACESSNRPGTSHKLNECQLGHPGRPTARRRRGIAWV